MYSNVFDGISCTTNHDTNESNKYLSTYIKHSTQSFFFTIFHQKTHIKQCTIFAHFLLLFYVSITRKWCIHLYIRWKDFFILFLITGQIHCANIIEHRFRCYLYNSCQASGISCSV